MTRDMAWIGFIATLLIGVVMAVYIWREPDQQDQRTVDLRVEAVVEGTDLYAETAPSVTARRAKGWARSRR